MKHNKVLSVLAAVAAVLTLPLNLPEGKNLFALPAEAADTVNVTKYSYAITPLLAPFNDFFFVKTDNPDPHSFRFIDKSTVYGDEAHISVDEDSFYETLNIYEDVKYEDISTARVNGGYIFRSDYTDGGQVVLQAVTAGRYSWEKNYTDTTVKLNVPKVKNELDYLIDTYATKTDFFDNMDAVQSGLSSVCLYSGSYIRGELTKPNEYWALSTSPHADQSFYIQSPYSRSNSKRLFASAIYPYRYDSLGFPGMMVTVAEKLNSNVQIKWDSYSHAHFTATLDGKSKGYGGQGIGEGQAITKDKILHYFTFGKSDLSMTLASAKQRLNDYSQIEMKTDIPEEGKLKWSDICDTVGDNGSWVRLMSLTSIFGGSSTAFTYLYKDGEGTDFWTDDAGDNGSEIYWGGDMGYYSGCWVDGRYINKNECWVPGEKFEDHPTDRVVFVDKTMPYVTAKKQYSYDYETHSYKCVYSDVSVTEKETTATFSYNSDNDKWIVSGGCMGGSIYFSDIEAMAEEGLISGSVLDKFSLTNDQMKAMKPDRNTCIIPKEGYSYDRTTAPGTPFRYVYGDVNLDGNVDLDDYSDLSKYLAKWNGYSYIEYYGLADLDNNGLIDLDDLSVLAKCLARWNGYMENYIK